MAPSGGVNSISNKTRMPDKKCLDSRFAQSEKYEFAIANNHL